ncbi:hypothetical protein Bca52824_009647 [Brassica carinata]|uniref:Uncharacterized protein n=1 Tax=Brassica carinata TaxID=52824 RepID=A0A8X8B718_BRACI|nr:hypothetical protein Bca52824_009647 [Brassica carinata]
MIGAVDNILARFPWIVWFIWKARNEKTFNSKQILPPDTVLHATREEENWRVAQVIEVLLSTWRMESIRMSPSVWNRFSLLCMRSSPSCFMQWKSPSS